MLSTFKAVSKSLGGLKVESEVRGFKISMDEPAELGGENTGMNPVEALLCALGSCQVIVANAFAQAQGFTLSNCYAEVEGDLDPDGFLLGLDEVRNGFQSIRITLHFTTDEPQEKCEAFGKFIQRTCPVGDCLENPVPVALVKVVKD